MNRRAFLTAVCAALAWPALAADRPHMVSRPTQTAAPDWLDYLAASPEPPAPAAVLDHTARLWRDLVSVNQQVNGSIRWNHTFGYAPLGPHREGNCLNAMLEKRQALAGMGYAVGALRPTWCLARDVRTDRYAGHAVLTVVTDREDVVLCNLDQAVQRWDAFRYVWDRRVGGGWELVFAVQS